MARKTKIILVDDVDGSEATQTVGFALDGVSYEIDLNDEHAAALRESIEEWSSKAQGWTWMRQTPSLLSPM